MYVANRKAPSPTQTKGISSKSPDRGVALDKFNVLFYNAFLNGLCAQAPPSELLPFIPTSA